MAVPAQAKAELLQQTSRGDAPMPHHLDCRPAPEQQNVAH